jgi:hypothetical protein
LLRLCGNACWTYLYPFPACVHMIFGGLSFHNLVVVKP